ncbi:UbiA family prenyltransferase [Micromonospora krabiensis]|uniref:4-hydroxybenzoate polyprenyltransferase n=1 Tax=Micromonospora krabiensis TaxID=307121 RepID=A0A1C3N9E8_9ACTN|nr:UbiA family prenyltransferase [Micromonospora krabiensis]SBV29225.1 4-hydroxybenzoate polyprenyltransferase [Micromonospora krabiensis]
MSTTVLGLVRASHPEPTAAVTTVAGLLAVGVGHRPAGTAAVALSVLASQLATGWTNDAVDAGRDAAVGRTDKPIPSGAVGRRTVAWSAAVAALATPALALLTNPWAAVCLTLALVSALLYDWPLKSTPLSVLPYAVSFGALPAFVVLALPGAPAPPVWLVTAGALLGAGAHFANVLPDLADDARTGVRGLPHRLGANGSRVAAAGLLLAATGTLVFGPPGPPSGVGLTAVLAAVVAPLVGWYGGRAAVQAGRRPVSAFRAVMLVALIDVVLLVTSGRVV